MRVLLCPTNIAGQLWEYAQGLRALGVEATVMTKARHPFGYPDDICLHLDSEPSLWRRRHKLLKNFLRSIGRYNVIHFSFGGTLLPHYVDLPLLHLMGKKMVMNYWGSDARLESVARVKNPYYDLTGCVKDDRTTSEKIRNVARHIKVAVVVDYELYDYVAPFFKQTVIIPQAIDTQLFQPAFPSPSKSVPLVVHSPSDKNIKGTRYVGEAVERLKKRHRFEFRVLHQLKNQEVKEITKQADIVIDQLLLGSYGVVSMEAMALGKPVLCYIREDLVDKYPADLPIVNANPDTIEEELERLLVNPPLRAEIGRRSREFVKGYHDSKIVAQRLIELYESL